MLYGILILIHRAFTAAHGVVAGFTPGAVCRVLASYTLCHFVFLIAVAAYRDLLLASLPCVAEIVALITFALKKIDKNCRFFVGLPSHALMKLLMQHHSE